MFACACMRLAFGSGTCLMHIVNGNKRSKNFLYSVCVFLKFECKGNTFFQYMQIFEQKIYTFF